MEKRQDSYAVLGVSRGASREDIEKRYAELQQLFSSPAIPADLAEWAAAQRERVRQAYHELVSEGGVPSPRSGQALSLSKGETEEVEPAEEEELPQPSTLRGILDRPLYMAAIGVVLGVIVLGIFFGVRAWTGKATTSPPPTQQSTAVDMARVKELEATVRREPKNEAAMQELGDLYLTAEKWGDAARWYGRLLEIDPKHVTATIDLGTAQFYLNKPDMAKMLWVRATELDPKNAEAHFNLGIFYSVVEPTDPEAAQREWQKVLEIDPNSRLAEIVRQHQQPPVTPTPGPAPAPTATP